MNTEHMQPLNRQILEEAAEWLVEFNTGDADPMARQRFDAWLRVSPEHVRAYLELLPLWEDGATSLPSSDASPEGLIAWARSTDNVVSLGETVIGNDREPAAASGAPSLAADPAGSARTSAPSRRRHLAMAASILLASAAVLLSLNTYRDPVYTTGIGEQHSIALTDGSVIEMNARSKLRVRFTADQRTVELLQGQALFRVAKDHARPFIVDSDGTRVRAVGTQFDVYRKTSGTTVTVLEGRVAVMSEGLAGAAPLVADGSPTAAPVNAPPTASADLSLAGAIFLSGGEQVTVSAAAPATPTRANLEAATAWTQRRLVFDAATLADVVEEFNRYNARRLVLRDAALEHFPITAAFSSTDPASLVRFLEAQPGISVTSTDDEIQIATTR